MVYSWNFPLPRAVTLLGLWLALGIPAPDTARAAELRLPPVPAIRFLADEHRRLWLTYPDDTIAMLAGGRVRIYSAADGLNVGNVLALEVKGGHVWAAGDLGVAALVGSRFVPVRGSGGELFRGTSGMVETPTGELWLNAAAGLFRVPRDSVTELLSGGRSTVDFERFDWRDASHGAPLALRFAIQPAFYQMAWFRLLCAVMLLVLVGLTLRVRVEQVKSRIRRRLDERHAERERIARDLHDTLLQGIQALLFRLQIWAGDPAIATERRQEIAAVVVQARAIVVEGRDRILTLRNAAPRCQDLFESLVAVGNTESAGQTARFEITTHGKHRLLFAEVCEQLVDIAREAVRNAHRHARASLVAMSVDYRGRSLRLRIFDDGQGIDPPVVAAGRRRDHFGLVGMRERADQLGARFSLESNRETGTCVTVIVPASVAFGNPWRWPWQRRAQPG